MSLIRKLYFFPASFTLLAFFIIQPALALPLPSTYTYDGANRLAAVDLASTVTRTLTPGWNFVAHPFLAAPMEVGSALSPLRLNTDYDQLSRHNGSNGVFEHFVGIDRYNQFTTVDSAKGYELYVTNPNGATVSLPQASPSRSQSLPLSQGWNLIGSPRPQTLPVSDALAPLVQGTDYDQVKQLNPSSGVYEPATNLAPGTAYWLHTLRATNLTIPAAVSHAITYTYNGDSTRVAKTVYGVTTQYLYDGLDLLAEFNGAGTLTTSYVHGPNLDELLATRNHATGQILYHLTDHLGSPIALVDQTQQIQATFTYAAFGLTRTKTGSADTRFRFTGRELDSESSLYHLRARAYDPSAARFLQPDPWPATPADPRIVDLSPEVLGKMVPWPSGMIVVSKLFREEPDEEEDGIIALASAVTFPLRLNVYPYVFNNPVDCNAPHFSSWS